ncbi:PAS/PAC sensor signal transduction histidine kinase [Candidatus Magnetomorum sp. HK-1]|nr:PAS/PAC sensor signal transduction histidine kinase [Candidatus Magnetomorum sp. HK-1]
MKNKTKSFLKELRKQAEVKCDGQDNNFEKLSNLSFDSKTRLIEELRTHQIELEIQNQELRRLQVELESSRNKYQNLYDFAPVGYITVNDKGIILEANLYISSLLGIDRSSLIGASFSAFIARDSQYSHYLNIKKFLDTNISKMFELKVKKKDKTEFYAKLECFLVENGDRDEEDDGDGDEDKDENENYNQIHIVITDIDKRKKAEEALKSANEKLEHRIEERTSEINKFKVIADNANYGMVICDLDGTIKYVNKYSANIHGYEPHELIDKNISIYHNKEQLKTLKKLNENLFEQGSYNAKELLHRHKNGKCFPMLMNGFIIKNKDNQPPFFSYTSVDISNMKSLQAQLIRSERLASTGKLAASIAHEINSPLQGITFMISSLKRKNKLDPEDIDLLNEAFQNIKNTVKNLLDLHRPSKELKQLVNVNHIIEQTLNLVRGYMKKSKIKTKLILSSKIPDIIASPQLLSQVFMNLINNAIEAMTGRSEPDESLKSIISKYGKITISTNLVSDKIVITFADTGPGISENDIEQIFDPFYTRKQKGGLGIGLSICHSIIEGHNGLIKAANLPGKGAKFTILLPVD